MQTRLVKEFVAEIMQQTSALIKQLEHPDRNTHENEILAILKAIEVRITIHEFRQLLEKHINSDEVATRLSLAPFYGFLTNRWDRVDKTDLSYPLASVEAVSQLCLMIATVLSSHDNQPVYDILMPTMISSGHEFPGRGNLSALFLREFIPGDNGEPLVVEQCFQYLENRYQSVEAHSGSRQLPRISRLNMQTTPLKRHLTLDEECLIRNHSKPAREYHDALMTNENVRECKRRFHEAIRCESYLVTASYGVEGIDRLMTRLLQRFRSSFELSELLFESVPKHQWNYFLRAMNKEDLFRITMGINLADLKTIHVHPEDFRRARLQAADNVLSKLTRMRPQFNSDDKLRAYVLCLLEAYEQSREEISEIKTDAKLYLKSIFSYSYSKNEQLQYCQVFRNFLLSDPPWPLDDLAGYLSTHHLAQSFQGLLTTKSLFGDEILSNLVSMTAEIGKRQYSQVQGNQIANVSGH